LSEGHIGDGEVTQRVVHIAQRPYFSGSFFVGVSLSLLAGLICLVRDLYIFYCIIKIHKLKNRFSHIVLLSRLFTQKYLSLMVVIAVIFSIVDQIYFSDVHSKFVKKPSCSHKEQFQKFKLNRGNNF
jgi:hypothetical protein